jgi:hypothetical protein
LTEKGGRKARRGWGVKSYTNRLYEDEQEEETNKF